MEGWKNGGLEEGKIGRREDGEKGGIKERGKKGMEEGKKERKEGRTRTEEVNNSESKLRTC